MRGVCVLGEWFSFSLCISTIAHEEGTIHFSFCLYLPSY